MRDTNYINIQGWMVNKLDLKGNELILFALIYGFSQDEESQYKGSLNYISSSLKIARKTVSNLTDRLIEKNYIVKTYDATGNTFQHNAPEINQILGGVKSTLVQNIPDSDVKVTPIASVKVTPNNNNNNNDTNDPLLFPKKTIEKNPSKKTIFANSKCTDINYVREKLLANKDHIERYNGVDLKYYMERVETWNDKGGKKTTARGWMAYIRQFMNSDIEAGKLVMRDRLTAKKTIVPEDAMKKGVHANF